MIAVVQRVSEAGVSISGTATAAISGGLLILLGIEENDHQDDVEWLARKIVSMRIFSDAEGKMNLSSGDVDADFLVISQFTLHASTKKGNRPSFIKAAPPVTAIPLYEQFLDLLSQMAGKPVHQGEFGADMQVSLINDGPVTIIIDSKDKK